MKLTQSLWIVPIAGPGAAITSTGLIYLLLVTLLQQGSDRRESNIRSGAYQKLSPRSSPRVNVDWNPANLKRTNSKGGK